MIATSITTGYLAVAAVILAALLVKPVDETLLDSQEAATEPEPAPTG